MTKKIHFLRKELPSIERAGCLVLAVLLIWKGILPGWQVLHTDFPNYYLVARLLREDYSLDRIYDWIWLQRIKDHWGIDQPLVGFAGLTPFSALPIFPLTFFAALTAKRLWIVVNMLLLCASVEGLHAVTSLGRTRVWLLCLLCAFPLRTSFLLGQMHLLVMALLVGAYYFHQAQKRTACAVCLSIAGLLKVYPFLFGLYFLLKKQWAAAVAMVSVAAVLWAASAMTFGCNLTQTYLLQVLPRSLIGEILDPYSAHAGSMAGLLHRLLLYEPQLNPRPWRDSPGLYALLYPTWQVVILMPVLGLLVRQRPDRGGEQLGWAAWVFTLLLLSPVPSSYHFVAMAFSMVLLADFLLQRHHYGTAACTLVLYCMISLVELLPQRVTASAPMTMGFGRLWIGTGFWLVLLFCLWRNCRKQVWVVRLPLRLALLSVVALLTWSVGVSGYLHHFSQLRQEMRRRLPSTPGVYLATGLRNTAAGYVFTAMSRESYQTLDQSGRRVSEDRGEAGTDELSVATTESTPDLLVEVADGEGSRLIVVPVTHDPQQSMATERLLMQDAESAAVSSDDKTVVFLRETKGRGTLWVAALETPLGHTQGAPMQLTGDAYDVRNFSLAPSGWIVFSARSGAHISLFRLVSDGTPIALLTARDDVDSPAISRDERFIAYTRIVHHRWQLEYFDRVTGQSHLLTTGDCNAYSPRWTSATGLAYASDCGRGFGLTALESVVVPVPPIH